MTEEQLKTLAQVGWDAQVEYKTCAEEVSDSLYESVSSFLNHCLGHILVSVQNDGKIVGVNPDKAEALKN